MKNIFLFVCNLVLFSLVAQSQSLKINNNWELGATASLFVNDVDRRLIRSPNSMLITLEGVENRTSLGGGVFLKSWHSRRLSSLIELQYTAMNMQFRQKKRDGIGDSILVRKDSYRYAQLNPMLGYRLFKGLSIYAGPSLNILLESVGRGRQVVTGRWVAGKTLFDDPGSIYGGDVKPIVLGLQAKMVYQYNRLAAHITYFSMQQRMGRWYEKRTNPVYNDFYFSSWQFGLAYSIVK